MPAALLQLSALHSSEGDHFRLHNVGAGEHVFPNAIDVMPMTLLLLGRISKLWAECRSVRDDMLVSAFAVAGVLLVHPFADGNGRIALDFAQYLLMCRWNLSDAPLRFRRQEHRHVGELLAKSMPACNGSAAALIEQRLRLAAWISSSTITTLTDTLVVVTLAKWMSERISMESKQ